ncbi:MAG: AMP-binding protein, partial [Bacteroidales bacterium]|nr:AMP-binding protein [Bacteroidales bacterium]
VDSDMERDFAAGFSPADLVFFKDSPDDLAIINYTSGTSGFAKGVMLPYRTLGLNVALMAESFPEITCDTNIVAMLPTAHMYGMMVDFIYEMTVGAHVHYLTRLPSPKVIMDACAAIRPDIVFTVPLMAEKVCRGLMRQMNYDYNPQSLSAEACAVAKAALEAVFGGNFSQLVIGGAPLSAEVEDFLLAIGFRYTVGSGMTECGPLVSVSRWDATKPHTCGRLAPYLSVRVDSPDASTVPGELYFKSDVLFKGYYKMPAETAEVMSADGWFRTGDIGLVGPDRFLTLKGRSKNMILTSTGHNIYPEEIESSVNNLPYVQESLIVEDRGKLLALIYPDHGQAAGDSLSDGDLYQALKAEIRTLNEALPTYCQIARFEIFPEEFEKTPKKSIKRYLYQR